LLLVAVAAVLVLAVVVVLVECVALFQILAAVEV
jgi:hypothetical protein